MLVGPGRYERAAAIFDRTRRTFHPITEMVSTQVDDAAVRILTATRGGAVLGTRITFPAPDVVRLQRTIGPCESSNVTEMLVGEPPALDVRADVTDELVRVDAGGPSLVLTTDPWRVEFGGFRTEPDDISILEWVAEPSGYAVGNDGPMMYETFALRPGEELYGLGERFHGPTLRGRRLSHWIDEPFGTNTTDRVHKSVPLVISNRGYGIFAHHPEEVDFDLGAGSNASASMLVHGAELDVFVMLGEPKDVLRSYTALTGRAPVPPAWTFGIWMSRCMYASRAEIDEVLDEAAEHDFPVDVIGVDPLWLADRPGKAYDTCDFVWNEADFGERHDFIDHLHQRGVRLCLWVNTHLDATSPAWRAERLVGGGRARDTLHPDRGYVDLTGAGGEWWIDEMRQLLEDGVDGFKLDYSETLPVDPVLADGRRGADVHNLYGLLASITASRAGAPVQFTRCGTAGSQRYPIHWAGDSQASWAGMHGALRGGLSAAWSGFAHWTCDIGGFFWRDLRQDAVEFAPADPELYVRWMQMGMLLSHTRFHGKSPREPWYVGDTALAVARSFADLRRRLTPYLLECARVAAESGCPIMRPIALEFPDDLGAVHIDTQYLLGPDLVVCPVLEPGGRVDVYVPAGTWFDHFTGEQFDGPRWVRSSVPLERLPLLVRAGSQPFAS